MATKAFIKGTDLELEEFEVGSRGKNVFFGKKYKHKSGAKVSTSVPAEWVEIRETYESVYPAHTLPGVKASS